MRRIVIFVLTSLVLSLLLIAAAPGAPGVTGLLVFLGLALPALVAFWLLQMRHAPRQQPQPVPIHARDMDALLAELNAANRPLVARVLSDLDLPDHN